MTITFFNHTIDDLNNEFVSFKKEDVIQTGYYKYRNRKEFSKKAKTDEIILKKNKDKIQRNVPPSYRDKCLPEQDELIESVLRNFDHALMIANTSDIKKSIGTIKNGIAAFNFPLLKKHYHYLISRLFPLLLKFKSTDVLLEVVTFISLLLLKGKRVIELQIKWEPLFKIFKDNCYIDSSVISFDENYDQDITCTPFLKNFIILVSYARAFFLGDSVIEGIHEEIKGYLIPQSNYIFFAQNSIYIFLPTYHLVEKTEMPKWVDTYLNLYWNWIDANKDWDERWLFILSRVVKHGHNIDWSPSIPSFFTRFVKVIDLSSPSLNRIKPCTSKIPQFYRFDHDGTDQFFSMGKLIAAFINKPTEKVAMIAFKNLFSQISLYFHPSNQGEWSSNLGELASSVSKAFLKRNIYNTLFPLLISTLYSKRKDSILYVCKVIKEFSYVAPNYVLPKVLDKFFNSMDKEEINRVISGIEVISTCIHPIITLLPEGKSLIFSFMEILIKNLDPIYLNKASGSFKFFNKLFSCILIADETPYIMECENQLDETTTLTTASFSEWSVSFVDAVISFMLKCSNKSSTKREAPPSMFIGDTLELFFSALSDDIYKAVLKRLVEFFTKSFEPEYYKLFSDFIKYSTLRDPVQSISSFLPVFINKLFVKHKHSNSNSPILTSSPPPAAIPSTFTSNYSLKELSDQEYKLYIGYIGYMVYRGGDGLVKFQDQLIDILNCLMSSDNKFVLKFASKVVRKIIFSLTRIYPSNYTFASKEIVNSKENHIKYWGTSDKSKFYPLDWFEPNEKTIEFAKTLIEKFLKNTNTRLNKTVEGIKNKSIQYNRTDLLRLLKPIQSIMRSTSYLLKDDSPIIPPKNAKFRIQYKQLTFEHGLVILEEFSTLKREIFENLKDLIGYIQAEKNEEVQVLRLIAKTFFVLFFIKNDVSYFGSDSLFEKWRNHKKCASRNYYIFRAYRMHLSRQKNHFDLSNLTEMVLQCCKELLNLSTHRYRKIRDVSQKSAVNIMIHYKDAHYHILPIALERISMLRSDEEVKGLCYILTTKTIMKKIKSNSFYFIKVIGVIIATSNEEFKPATQNSLSDLKKDLLSVNAKPINTIHYSDELNSIENGTYDCEWLPKEYILESKEYNQKILAQNRENLLKLLQTILSALKQHKKKSSQTWKSHLFLLSNLSYLFTILFYSTSEFENFNMDFIDENRELIREIFVMFSKETLGDYPFSRIYSIFCISLILNRQGSKNVQFTYDGYFRLKQFNGIDENEIKKPVDLTAMDRNLDFVKTIYSIVKDDINQQFDNQTFIDNVIKKIISDHDGEGLSVKFAISLSSKKLSTLWPNTRLSSFSLSNFRAFNADLIYGLFSTIGVKFFDLLKPSIEDLRTKTHKDELGSLAEIMAGLCRYISVNSELLDGRFKEIQEYSEKVLLNGFTNSSNEASDVWEMAVRYITNNIIYEKISWIGEILFKNYKVPTANILGKTKAVRLLKYFLFEVPWKCPEFTKRVADLASDEFSNSYKQIRVDSLKLFSQILVYQTDFTVYPPIVPEELLKKITSMAEYIEKSSPPSSTPPNINSPPYINSPPFTGSPPTQLNNNNGNPSILTSIASPPNESILLNYNPTSTEKEKKTCLKESLTTFVYYMFSKSNLLIRSTPSLLKVIMELHADSNIEISKDCTIIIYRISQEFYCNTKIIDEIIATINQTLLSPSWKIRSSILPFIQIFFFNHCFYFTPNQVESIINIVLTLTRDQHIEIRESSKTTLASILISSKSNINRVKDLIKKSIAKLKTPGISTIEKHSSILVLCAIVLANPYEFPTYLPEVLEQLSRFAYNSNFKGASTVLSDFWRTHSSTWEEDKLQFTESQIEDIQSTKVAPSYFA
ncbi:hypothetical protein DICPUDRAFT_147828 [Dictyostelium purpureum]|uniref:Proteasome activator complex subunit 4 C-terminal domain-containing protein n=1 Tax=Dictyostelium purpureum TaxID=5786 RepID=F0Z9I5_DICPU|nr:uncharacterized protein DICPUDRAFT_147828 [Dictyostelium purpureum]EGC39414.1 hypothetical protein DICPUDRAFT_147828 [Dictyostelium purpureum]|eukprot:XP_003284088.1 hypothetical protein DICPUDRAFT_147828 [Dictyostelium purpureum]